MNEITPTSDPSKTPSLPKSQIIVVEMLYHMPLEDQPTCTESRFSRWVMSDEQPYRRVCKVKEDWQGIDIGWLVDSGVGMLHIENTEGISLQTQLTEQEQSNLNNRILEVGIAVSEAQQRQRTMHDPVMLQISTFARIPPKESIRFTPLEGATYVIRCRHDTARCIITALPT